MSVAYVPQASFLNPQPFNPSDNLSDGSDRLNPSLHSCLIEKYLTQLGKIELLGEPYVKDYLNDQNRRNCRASNICNNFITLLLFLSYLQDRGRTSLETTTRAETYH